MIKGLVQQQDIPTLSTCEPNPGVPSYVSRTLLAIRVEKSFNRILVEGFSICFHYWMDHLDKT